MTTIASTGHLMRNHPCFSAEAHINRARIHLPVSPGCNIRCRFCSRSLNETENRPGVARGILSPDDAVGLIRRGLELCPEIAVVGIAGPGEALASENALVAFEKVHREFPDLLKCLSTNGLLLAEKAEDLVRVGVSSVTVTVNAVNPVILERICAGIIRDGKRFTGIAGMRVLIDSQLRGIEKASALGLVVKINTVLIPGINDYHIEEVARKTAESGASFINLIPLIPQHEMSEMRPPTCEELNDVREAAEKYLPVFRHCRQCRADACGVPGRGVDFASQLYGEAESTFSHG